MALPYYRWFPGDYIRDTRRLTMLQHGAYRLLIDEYMVGGKPLPNDLPALYRICGAVSGEEQVAVRYALEEFFILSGPVWKHKRCDDELAHQHERSKSAKDSAERRWKAKQSDANAMRTHSEGISERNANQNQIREKKEAAPSASIPEGVQETHWRDWLKARKTKRAGEVTETVIAGMRREAEKAGISLGDAVRECAERSWISLKADWLLRDGKFGGSVVQHPAAATPDEAILRRISEQNGGMSVTRLRDGRLQCGVRYYRPNGVEEMSV
jgi:uncharacterized protein YdaU (DUF1376 family)